MKVGFESKPTCDYDDKYIKTKIKRYADSITTNFHYKKMPKEKVSCKLLSIIMLDSVVKSDEKYYPQIFLEEYNKSLIVCLLLSVCLKIHYHSFISVSLSKMT